MADEFCLKMPDFHVTFMELLNALNLRHGTEAFTSPPKEGVLRIFFALKNPTAFVVFEPANLGTKGQYATSGPPKPLSPLMSPGFSHRYDCSLPTNFLSKLRGNYPCTLFPRHFLLFSVLFCPLFVLFVTVILSVTLLGYCCAGAF